MAIPGTPEPGEMTQHFEAAADPALEANSGQASTGSSSPTQQFDSAASGSQPADINAQNEAMRAAVEADIARYEADVHYKPDDKALVQEVDSEIDNAARQELNDGFELDF